jgi:hypothetical protein
VTDGHCGWWNTSQRRSQQGRDAEQTRFQRNEYLIARFAAVQDVCDPCGMRCSLRRPTGEGPLSLGPKPDITGPDFRSVANQIVAAESRQA